MRTSWSLRSRATWALVTAPALAIAGLSVAAAGPASAAHSNSSSPGSGFTVKPNAVSNVDCNGWSLKYKPAMPAHRQLCADPHGQLDAHGSYRFSDNGHYVGHDEPSVRFLSKTANSSNTMTFYMRLPVNPAAKPTNTASVTTYAELSAAPWFGLPICDPGSYPQNPCKPHSDSNLGASTNPKDAGSAFMELQFYAPTFAPFADNVSCNATRWCAALTIDSVESKFNFVGLNPNCVEPVNFAFLQTNGVPAGPPSPQLTDASTFTPNKNTLMMNSGDLLKVRITDPLTGTKAGFTTTIRDLTTGKTGFMIASASRGFMNTNYLNCNGKPFTFHAEYNTAQQKNEVPWTALEAGVLMQQETGHSEVCASLKNKHGVNGPPGFSDPNVFDTCVGGAGEGTAVTGEGGCNGATGVCTGATTENGAICPSNKFTSGDLCEFADGACIPQGTRTVSVNGHLVKETQPVNFCEANRFQNGDLDFDGTPYINGTWPDGGPNQPTSIRYVGPFDTGGRSYPTIQFETDLLASENLCNVGTGAGCTVPPTGAAFYPFWTMTSKQRIGGGLFTTTCPWNFGNIIAGITTRNFGKDAQYGTPDTARFGGTATSKVLANPQSNGSCKA